MQSSSLPINSTLQNNPRYQFSLKSESIEIFDDFVGGHFENKNNPECNWAFLRGHRFQNGRQQNRQIVNGL
jgi:hypothetical protein